MVIMFPGLRSCVALPLGLVVSLGRLGLLQRNRKSGTTGLFQGNRISVISKSSNSAYQAYTFFMQAFRNPHMTMAMARQWQGRPTQTDIQGAIADR